jgi:hypothetical protein
MRYNLNFDLVVDQEAFDAAVVCILALYPNDKISFKKDGSRSLFELESNNYERMHVIKGYIIGFGRGYTLGEGKKK